MILLAYLLGAMVMSGWLREAVVVAGAVEVMLSAKAPLQRFVQTLSPEDWVATMKFVVVTLVVLPVLPNAHFGPYGAFNPFKIWLMVVMISGISFLGYALTKAIGAERGLLLTGLIGGLASSTAVTLSSAKQSKDDTSLSPSLAVGTLLACTVMLPRLALILWALCPPLALRVLPGMGTMLLVSLTCAVIQYRQVSAATEPAGSANREQPHRNPFEMHSALKFAVVFAFITLLVKWVEAAGAGAKGLYLVSFVAGLVETDAICVTLAEQVRSVATALPLAAAAKGVVLAAVANTLLKGGLSYAIGSKELGRKVLPPLVGTAVVGAVVVWFGT